MNSNSAKKNFLLGLRQGIPIAIGYFSVSFTFGIISITFGLNWWQAVLISMLTVTSAGQFSGIQTMCHPGLYIEMFISQITINVRYSFMSISISQKVDEKFRGIFRWLLAFFMTDEIFAVASAKKEVSRSFFFGLACLPWWGWSLGTLCGTLLGSILPDRVMSALGLAIYGMFIAIVIPPLKNSKALLLVVITALVLSCCFYYIPLLKNISSGITITICAVVAAAVGAIVCPRKIDEEVEENE